MTLSPILRRFSLLEPPTCGVMRTFGAESSGLFGSGGSLR